MKNSKIGRKITKIAFMLIFSCFLVAGIRVSNVYGKDLETPETLKLLTDEEYRESMRSEESEEFSNQNLEKSVEDSEMVSIIDQMKGKPDFLDECLNEDNIAFDLMQPLNEISLATIPTSTITPRIINQESIKNGQITTDTQIAWFVNFSDADGDSMIDFQYGGFPGAYYLGAFEYGFVTQFSNPGEYTVLYRALDSSYEYSQIVGYRVSVVPVEDYDVIEDEFTSLNEQKTYSIDIDFSNIDTAAICFVNMGQSALKAEVKDSEGNLIVTRGTGDGRLKSWCFINKPTQDTSLVSYTVDITCTKFVENSGKFRVISGDKKDTEAMLGGPENASPLEWFTEKESNAVSTYYTPNKDECWFLLCPERSSVTFTLLTKHPELRFKILDKDNLYTLFDSNEADNENVHKDRFCIGYPACEKAKISGWTVGEEYYLVLYSPNRFTTQDFVEDGMNVAVGLPHMQHSALTDSIYASRQITATSSAFSSDVLFDVQCDGITLPQNSYVSRVEWMGDRPSIMSLWRVKEPQSSTWRQSKSYWKTIDIDYEDDSDSNTLMSGIWRAGFKTTQGTGTHTFLPALRFFYSYEIGD